MTRVVIATVRLLEFMEGGGHFWAYMQYVEALRRLGCEVHVLDSSIWSDQPPDTPRVQEFHDRMARHGLRDRVIVAGNGDARASLPDVLDQADLLLELQLPPEPGCRVGGRAYRAGGYRPGSAAVLDQPRVHLARGARPVFHDRRDGGPPAERNSRLRSPMGADPAARVPRPVAIHPRP